jgi:hypothetical protein
MRRARRRSGPCSPPCSTGSYLGNYIGEFLGELSFSVFFLLSAAAMLHPRSGFSRWLGVFGLFTAVFGLVGMFRNVTAAVGVVAEINNYLLPAWMIAFGIGLWRARRPGADLVRPPVPSERVLVASHG